MYFLPLPSLCSDALDLVRFDSSLLKGHAARHSVPALPHALWASDDSLDKLKAEQRLELRSSDYKSIRSQNPPVEHFLGLAFNKCIGGWHAADVLLAQEYRDIFCKLGTPSCRKTSF